MLGILKSGVIVSAGARKNISELKHTRGRTNSLSADINILRWNISEDCQFSVRIRWSIMMHFDSPTRPENAYIMACCDNIHNMHTLLLFLVAWWPYVLAKFIISHFEYRWPHVHHLTFEQKDTWWFSHYMHWEEFQVQWKTESKQQL